MKITILIVSFVVFLWALPAAGQMHPRPPGLQQANQAEAKAERDMPPPLQSKTTVDLVKAAREASELATLAQSIPPCIDALEKGTLPKDLVERLKRVEMLSKRLRRELTP